VTRSSDLKHPIAREVLQRYEINNIDIAVMSDVPAGTGLGSSSSFTVAFLGFVRHLCGIPSTPVDLAREACEIEIEVLKEPIGYQDQWASALGGLNIIRFSGSDVQVESVGLGAAELARLQKNLHLVPVGKPRSAGNLLARQGDATTSGSKAEDLTRRMVEQVEKGKAALMNDIDLLGPLLHEAWLLKRQLTSVVTNPEIDEAYQRGIDAGATGGKLLGAGGSGYLAFYVPLGNQAGFRELFPKRLKFRISTQGAGVIHES
jgi:D-glycero-alpha-D-manno-heptose-7-phosphate kinase